MSINNAAASFEWRFGQRGPSYGQRNDVDTETESLMDVDRDNLQQDEEEGVESSSDSRGVSRIPLAVRLYSHVLSNSSALKAVADTSQRTEQYLNLFLNETKDVAAELRRVAAEMRRLSQRLDTVESMVMSLASKKKQQQQMWPRVGKLKSKSRSHGRRVLQAMKMKKIQ
jgi:hypothetical protein